MASCTFFSKLHSGKIDTSILFVSMELLYMVVFGQYIYLYIEYENQQPVLFKTFFSAKT